ncbi:MAG: 50S ribosomal protein L11 methyltransferase [Pseudomonadota bacterium]
MTTYTALTTLADAKNAQALGIAMETLDPEPTGIGVFEFEDGSGLWEVGGYFTEAPDEIALALLAAAHNAAKFAVSALPETDWVAKVRRELAPVQTARFFVYGSHDADRVPSDKTALLIEASMAFGTGHHGTTLGCLQALEQVKAGNHNAKRILDLGCGTAVLAMAAATLWPEATVLASDIDAVAVEVAEANLLANSMVNRVEALQAEGLAHPKLAAAQPFDLIVANILKGPLLDLAPDLSAATAEGGVLILSGILLEQSAEVQAHYAQHGFDFVGKAEITEWATLTLRR